MVGWFSIFTSLSNLSLSFGLTLVVVRQVCHRSYKVVDVENCDSEVGYKTNYSSAWLTRSLSLALRISEYMYTYV